MLACCVLCHGDHPGLADRCLGSIVACLPDPALGELRVALSGASEATRAVALRHLDAARDHGVATLWIDRVRPAGELVDLLAEQYAAARARLVAA